MAQVLCRNHYDGAVSTLYLDYSLIIGVRNMTKVPIDPIRVL